MTDDDRNTTTAKALFRFHGLNLLVVEFDGAEYVQAKPISDLLGMLWKSTKRSLFSGDNALLYGTKELRDPSINDAGTTGGTKISVYLELKQVFMFLARTSTNNLRAKGNLDGANYLLALQREWGNALYSYEMNGAAYKKTKLDFYKEITKIQSGAERCRDPDLKKAYRELAEQELLSFGIKVKETPDLFD